jgi:glycosyltransferase involved in cell wall biosynthesis
VEKKGFGILLEAAARLRAPYRLRIVGDGPDRPHLSAAVERLGLTARVELSGGLTHAELPAVYAGSDVVVVPSISDSSGDRDGLPNVLVEAQSQRLPCIATRLPGVAELMEEGRTGLLVPPGDRPALAAVLERLIRSPGLRARLGAAGEARVRREFDMRGGVAILAERFGLSPEMPEQPAAAPATTVSPAYIEAAAAMAG